MKYEKKLPAQQPNKNKMVEIGAYMLISELRYRIHQMTQLPLNAFKLIYAGRELQE